MNKNAIVQDAIDQMVRLIQRLNSDNVDEIEAEVLKYFRWLNILTTLKVSSNDDFEPHLEESSKDTPLEDVKARSKNSYEFERHLKGGYIREIDVFVPEKIIRQLGFEDGDLISAVSLGNKMYHYELVEKAKERRPTNRIQLNFCVLSKRDSMLVASEYLEDGELKSIKYNDAPYTFRISDETRIKEDLEEGSIVDIAYYKDNVDVFRVIWKHQLPTEGPRTPPLKSSHYKIKNPKSDTTETNELLGKKVLLVGDKGRIVGRTAELQNAIQRNGGELIHADGSETINRLESMVKNCDLLISIVTSCSHIKAEKAKEFAKKYDKPFKFIDSIGISTLVQTAKSLVSVEV